MKKIYEILMERDGLSEEDAKKLVEEAKKVWERLEHADNDNPFNFCKKWFGRLFRRTTKNKGNRNEKNLRNIDGKGRAV
jgi:uncharacterized protein with von Willebrand factor type A (vWA) domain